MGHSYRPDVGEGNSGEASDILIIRKSTLVTLTNAQIRDLPTHGIQLVAAPGVGKALLLLSGLYVASFIADYTLVDPDAYFFIGAGITPSSLKLSNSAVVGDGNFLDAGGGDLVGWVTPATSTSDDFTGVVESMGYGLSSYANKPLGLCAQNPTDTPVNFTGGNAANILKVKVYYAVVEL